MPVVDVSSRIASPQPGMSAADLYGAVNRGIDMRRTDLTNQFNTFNQRFLADEPQRLLLLKRATDPRPEMAADAAVARRALEAEKAQMMTTYGAFNKATGGRMSDADVAAYVDNYWTRYDWRAPTGVQRGNQVGGSGFTGREDGTQKTTAPSVSATPAQSSPNPTLAQTGGPWKSATEGATDAGNPAESVVTPGTEAGWSKGLKDVYAKSIYDFIGENQLDLHTNPAFVDVYKTGDVGAGIANIGNFVELYAQNGERVMPAIKPLLDVLDPAVASVVMGKLKEARTKYEAMEATTGSARPSAESGVPVGYGTTERNTEVKPPVPSRAPASYTYNKATDAITAWMGSAKTPMEYKTWADLTGAANALATKLMPSASARERAVFVENLITNELKLDARSFAGGPKTVAMANGGAVAGPTLAVIGEGGEREYVVPESKARTWAELLLGTGEAVNPRDIPRMAAGNVVDPTMNQNEDPNVMPSYMQGGRELGPRPMSVEEMESARISATPPAAAKPSGSAAMKVAVEEFAKMDTDKISLPPGRVPTKETDSLTSIANDKRGARHWGNAVNAMKLSPEAKEKSKAISSGFSEWFDNASPEELALLTGGSESAKYRDAKLDRTSRDKIAADQSKLAWAYYYLQEQAAQGDDFSAKIKPMLDYGIEILKSNQKAIDEKGLATVMKENPTVADAVNLFTWVQGGKTWASVPKGIFGIANKLVPDSKGTPPSAGGVVTGVSGSSFSSLEEEARR